ncbi:hypothetical protein D043_0794A, partial [Vibrio parahaemolyticus EKP-021]
MQNGVKSAY